jgi:hypothetical protein
MVLTVDALADGVDPRELVHRIVATVRPPRVAPTQDEPDTTGDTVEQRGAA